MRQQNIYEEIQRIDAREELQAIKNLINEKNDYSKQD